MSIETNDLSIKYYKYRTIDNYKYFTDIILYNRLFATTYNKMNDPMEGYYYTNNTVLNTEVRNKIFSEKGGVNFCCLAKRPNNMLMWSHYANGHTGIAIGVKISKQDNYIKQLEYFNDLTFIDRYDESTVRQILSQKLKYWEYEEEYRIFPKNNNKFIECKIEDIILGRKILSEDERLIRDLVNKIDHTINVVNEEQVQYFQNN